MSFAKWLQQELDKRGWEQAELARRSGITRGQISRLLNESRQAGPELCISLAEALSLSREEVFRARGWLLEEATENPQAQLSKEVFEAAVKLEHLPLSARQIALRITHATADSFREESS